MADRRDKPVVGISPDVIDHPRGARAQVSLTYVDAVVRAGGVPIILTPVLDDIAHQLDRCDAVLLTGGDDPRTEAFNTPTHPKVTPIHPIRQAYEHELVRTIWRAHPDVPTLGVCLGMQWMALVAGGSLDQYMPETTPTADRHWDRNHLIEPSAADRSGAVLAPGTVHSRHKQAVADPGSLRVIARADDGVIEAVGDPARAFFVGVQWHPERTEDAALGQAIVDQFVAAARRA